MDKIYHFITQNKTFVVILVVVGIINYFYPINNFFIPPIKIAPEEMKLSNVQGGQKTSFAISNNSDNTLFDIAIMIELEGVETIDFSIVPKDDRDKEALSYQLGEFRFSSHVVRLKNDDGGKFALLKIPNIVPNSTIIFDVSISKSVNAEIKYNVFSYSKTPVVVGWKADATIQAIIPNLEYPPSYKGKKLEITGLVFLVKTGSGGGGLEIKF